jgi:GT2 family glycosyltransferase
LLRSPKIQSDPVNAAAAEIRLPSLLGVVCAPPAPRVLVAVLNWNHAEDTIECLESLFETRYGAFTVMVCDNASTGSGLEDIAAWADRFRLQPSISKDKASGFSRHLNWRLMERAVAENGGDENAAQSEPDLILVQTGANLGFAGGNNVALRYAVAREDYDFVWVLNNDTLVDARALGHMVRVMRGNPKAGAVGSTIYFYDEPTRIQSLGGGPFNTLFGIDSPYQSGHVASGEVLHVEHLLGASMLVRTSTIRDVGVMDESYFLYREETDWCLRMRERRWQLVSALQSRVWHKIGATVSHRSPLHDYYSTRNMLLLVKRHYPKKVPTVAAYTFLRAMLPKIVRCEFGRMPYVWKAFADFYRGVEGKVDLDPAARAKIAAISEETVDGV